MLGETISHYQILDRLGRGAMGVIYRAVDTTLGRQVALKFLPDGILNRTPAAPSEYTSIRRTRISSSCAR
jgi:serine/threonine protein kinase